MHLPTVSSIGTQNQYLKSKQREKQTGEGRTDKDRGAHTEVQPKEGRCLKLEKCLSSREAFHTADIRNLII